MRGKLIKFVNLSASEIAQESFRRCQLSMDDCSLRQRSVAIIAVVLVQIASLHS